MMETINGFTRVSFERLIEHHLLCYLRSPWDEGPKGAEDKAEVSALR